jgi:hypothetical protein
VPIRDHRTHWVLETVSLEAHPQKVWRAAAEKPKRLALCRTSERMCIPHGDVVQSYKTAGYSLMRPTFHPPLAAN